MRKILKFMGCAILGCSMLFLTSCDLSFLKNIISNNTSDTETPDESQTDYKLTIVVDDEVKTMTVKSQTTYMTTDLDEIFSDVIIEDWYLDKDFTTKVEQTFVINKDMTIYGKRLSQDDPNHVHVFTMNAIVKNPTCIEEGLMVSTCKCGYKVEKAIPTGDHSYVVDEMVESSCSRHGLSEGKHCEVCGFVLIEQEELPYTDYHNFNKVERIEPTCTLEGKKEGKKCIDCGKVLGCEAIPALGHTPVALEYIAPTCASTGRKGGKKCSVCDEIIEEPTTLNKTNIHTTKLVNDKVATCSEKGYTGDEQCTICNKIVKQGKAIDKLNHTYDEGKVLSAPTCTVDGKTIYTCKVCSHQYTVGYLKLGHSPVTEYEYVYKCVLSYYYIKYYIPDIYSLVVPVSEEAKVEYKYQYYRKLTTEEIYNTFKDDFVNTAVNDSKQYTSHGLKSAIPRANTNKEGLYIESQEVEKTITKIHCARCGAILQNE